MATTDPQLPVRIDQALTGRSDTARKPAERRGCIAHYRTHFAHRPYSDSLATRPSGPVHGRGAARHPQPTSKLMLTILVGVATWEREIVLGASARASPKRRPPASTKAAPSASTWCRSSSCGPRWGRGDREAPRHCPEQRLSRAGCSIASCAEQAHRPRPCRAGWSVRRVVSRLAWQWKSPRPRCS
jgi:hypothetical protein